MEALDFLQSIAGFAQTGKPGTSLNNIRLGTIDPAYVANSFPGTLPKITFDGETTMSTKTYPVMAPYSPVASDRVALVPIGATYLILGPVDYDTSAYLGGSIKVASGGADITGTTRVRNTNPTDVALATIASADSFDRVRVDASGTIAWGPGNATRDTNLYRSAADTLKTDDSLIVTGTLTANGTVNANGAVNVTGTLTASGVVYSMNYSGTTDASGFLTVTHGAPWTPIAGWFITTNPASSFAQAWGIDTIGSTTCRLRFASVNSGTLASTAVSGRLFLIK